MEIFVIFRGYQQIELNFIRVSDSVFLCNVFHNRVRNILCLSKRRARNSSIYQHSKIAS